MNGLGTHQFVNDITHGELVKAFKVWKDSCAHHVNASYVGKIDVPVLGTKARGFSREAAAASSLEEG